MGTKHLLNEMCGSAHIVQLGSRIDAMITMLNEMKTDFNALLAKLDGDAGVTSTNYVASCAIGAADITVLD